MSLLDQISRKVEGNESRGEGEAEEEREREQGSGKVEKEEEEEAKGNLACGFGNVITVYSDLLWFLPARYPIPTTIITTSPTGYDWVLLEGNKREDSVEKQDFKSILIIIHF